MIDSSFQVRSGHPATPGAFPSNGWGAVSGTVGADARLLDPPGIDGYSFVELLISLVIVTTLLGALYTGLFQSQATFEAQMSGADQRQTARVAAETLAAELRMTGADIGNLPEALIAAGQFGVQFATDVDNGSPAAPCDAAAETAVDGGAERITYAIAGGMLNRTVDCWDGATWTNEYTNQAVADNLVNATVARPLFRYYDEDDVELVPPVAGGLTAAQRDAVRVIEITVVLDDGTDHALADSLAGVEISTQVKLRNAGLQ